MTQWTNADRFFEFSLLGLLASGYLAVLGSGYLDAPTAVLTAFGLLLRALIVLGLVQLPFSERAVTWLTVGYIGFYPMDYLYLSEEFLPATVHLVFFLAVVKVLTAKTNRDYVYVKMIAFLELLAAAILSGNANFFLFLAMFLVFGVATFAASEIRGSAQRADTVVRTGQRGFNLRLGVLTVCTVLGVLLLTSVFFFFLPRTARAAMQRLIPERYHLPGFSTEVSLGQIGELKMRNTAVMHIRIFQQNQPMALKWRGAALTHFDGKRWYNPRSTAETLKVTQGIVLFASQEEQLRPGKRIGYEVAMQEAASDALFFAGVPEWIRINVPLVIRTPADSYRLGFGPPDRLRYTAHSLLEVDGDPRFRGTPLSAGEREESLQMPALDPRIQRLAMQVASGTEEQRVRGIEQYLRTAFAYTTELPEREVPDPIAHFLFERKKGHCEYFASSMAVMLRSIGIPSRVVTGFQSGVYNPISEWYLIRASDAHSWVEAWLPNRGWTTFDPTPPDPNPQQITLLTRLHFYLDAMQVFWQDWVLSYDLEQQLNLAAKVERSRRGMAFRWLDGSLERAVVGLKSGVEWARRSAPVILGGLAVLAGLILAAPALVRWLRHSLQNRRMRSGQISASDATVLYGRMLRTLQRKGIEKPAWVTPREFARTMQGSPRGATVVRFTEAYHDLRYGGRRSAAGELVRLLEEIERSK